MLQITLEHVDYITQVSALALCFKKPMAQFNLVPQATMRIQLIHDKIQFEVVFQPEHKEKPVLYPLIPPSSLKHLLFLKPVNHKKMHNGYIAEKGRILSIIKYNNEEYMDIYVVFTKVHKHC